MYEYENFFLIMSRFEEQDTFILPDVSRKITTSEVRGDYAVKCFK